MNTCLKRLPMRSNKKGTGLCRTTLAMRSWRAWKVRTFRLACTSSISSAMAARVPTKSILWTSRLRNKYASPLAVPGVMLATWTRTASASGSMRPTAATVSSDAFFEVNTPSSNIACKAAVGAVALPWRCFRIHLKSVPRTTSLSVKPSRSMAATALAASALRMDSTARTSSRRSFDIFRKSAALRSPRASKADRIPSFRTSRPYVVKG